MKKAKADKKSKVTDIVDLEKARLEIAAKKAYRNWASQFGEAFGIETCLSDISLKTLASLTQGRDKSAFYLYDLIMNLLNLGSGFEFDDLNSKEKLRVVDRYLFLLDQIRFEYMKRLGWLESYPGQEFILVELIMNFDQLSQNLHGKVPALSPQHPAYGRFCKLDDFGKGELIRKLIPKALKQVRNHSTTL